jgi:uncharacterized protein (TIGR02996 family)
VRPQDYTVAVKHHPGRSDIMNDERAFLTAILERPDDDATKLVYADWLEEQGDPRGEYLRLMMKMRQERGVTPEQRQRHTDLSAKMTDLGVKQEQLRGADRGSTRPNRTFLRQLQGLQSLLVDLSRQMRQTIPARLQELAATIDANWLAVVSDPGIEGCRKSEEGFWWLRFDFVCDKTWADMTPTDDNNVRNCELCSKSVYFCDNITDARGPSQEGHCIAIDLGVIRRDGDLVPRAAFTGQPRREDLRQSYKQELDPVSQARLDARR